MRLIEWFALLGLALLWGMSFMLVELALLSFAPFTLVFARIGIAALLMLWYIRRRQPWQLLRQRWRIYLPLGFFGSAFPFLCFAWGQQYIESGLASVLNALTPLFTLVLALCIGREKYSTVRAVGIIIGILGVAVLVGPDTAASERNGIIAAIVAAVCYAIATTFAWTYASQFSPRENAAGQLFFAALLIMPFALYEQPWRVTYSLTPLLAIFLLAVFSTFCAYLLYYYLLSKAGGVNAVLAVLLIPLVAVTLGIVILNERFSSEFFIGGVLIIAGVILTDNNLRRRLAGGWRVRRS